MSPPPTHQLLLWLLSLLSLPLRLYEVRLYEPRPRPRARLTDRRAALRAIDTKTRTNTAATSTTTSPVTMASASFRSPETDPDIPPWAPPLGACGGDARGAHGPKQS